MLPVGQLLVNDHAMREGDAQWVSLGQLFGGGGDTLENYNRVAETAGGLSLRKWDNIIQAIVVVVGTLLCTVVAIIMKIPIFMGFLVGLVIFGLGSGVVLMILRWFKKGGDYFFFAGRMGINCTHDGFWPVGWVRSLVSRPVLKLRS